MRLGGPELLIILALVLILYLTRGRSLTKKIKEKKQAKAALKSGTTASASAQSSSSSKKTEDSGDYKQTLKYAGVAFACIGLLFILAASLVPENFVIYLYIAGGLFVGIGVVALIMLFLVSKKD